ncbi:MAG TPA: hypothetical protein VL093_05040 [Flavipsychrobacter sp.]|nr:hypothetical protein [Flavipsychrobacter sp.]
MSSNLITIRFLFGENKSIDELFIVRTCLYFTKYIPTTESRPPQNPNYGIITRFSHKLNPLNDKWTEESGWYKQVTCHPQSTKTHEIAEAFLNTIDCGLLLEISKNYLKAFIEENLYGFLSTQLSSTDEITQIRQDYELIPVLP